MVRTIALPTARVRVHNVQLASPNLSDLLFRRYLGVIPVSFLKKVLKAVFELKPLS